MGAKAFAVDEIFWRARQFDSEDRVPILDGLCPEGSPLREEVEALLAAFDRRRDALARRAVASRQFGAYVLLDRLDDGAFGQVWRAIHAKVVTRVVAIKWFRPLGDVDEQYEQVVREATTASAALCEHVVPVHDVGRTEDGRVFLIMELWADVAENGLVPAKSLARIGGLPEREAARVMADASRGVAAAHARKIIHRDIKPANILLKEVSRKVGVIDFGLSQSTQAPAPAGRERGAAESEARESPSPQTRIAGTPEFMAPEQARGERADERSDVYGLGATLRFLLTKRPPYPLPANASILDPARATLAMVQAGPPEALETVQPDLPKRLARICAKAMAYAAKDRYASAALLADDLQAYAEDRPTSLDRRFDPILHGRLWTRRNPQAARAAGLLLVASVFIVVFVLGAVRSDRRAIGALTVDRDDARRQVLATKEGARDLTNLLAQSAAEMNAKGMAADERFADLFARWQTAQERTEAAQARYEGLQADLQMRLSGTEKKRSETQRDLETTRADLDAKARELLHAYQRIEDTNTVLRRLAAEHAVCSQQRVRLSASLAEVNAKLEVAHARESRCADAETALETCIHDSEVGYTAVWLRSTSASRVVR